MRRTAAAVALIAATALLAGCGEKEERVPPLPAADVRALVESGAAAVGSRDAAVGSRGAALPLDTWTADGPTLRIRTSSVAADSGLLGTLAHFSAVVAQIVPFCPKPAILGCKPALQARGTLRERRSAARVIAALRDLVSRTYEQRALTRRTGPGDVDFVTANGELLAAARVDGRDLRVSFGGAPPPARGTAPARGELRVEAGPDAIATMRESLPPRAVAALAGVRRLELVASL